MIYTKSKGKIAVSHYCHVHLPLVLQTHSLHSEQAVMRRLQGPRRPQQNVARLKRVVTMTQEHGGFVADDRNVALLAAGPLFPRGEVSRERADTTQVCTPR